MRKKKRVALLRDWARFMAESDFSENECREALVELIADAKPDVLERWHVDMHNELFDAEEWDTLKDDARRSAAGREKT